MRQNHINALIFQIGQPPIHRALRSNVKKSKKQMINNLAFIFLAFSIQVQSTTLSIQTK